MKKRDFLQELKRRLKGLSEEELTEKLAFYNEMIDDRIEEGFSEEEAVADIIGSEGFGSECDTEELLGHGKKGRSRLGAFEITLIVLGSPIWISAFAALFSLVVGVFAAVWAVAVSFWAVVLSLAVCSVAALVVAVAFLAMGKSAAGLMLLSGSLLCAGFALLLFCISKWITQGAIVLTKGFVNIFLRRSRRGER